MSLKMNAIHGTAGTRCSAGQIIQFRRCGAIFSENINIFSHLKLGIALAILASNDEKYN